MKKEVIEDLKILGIAKYLPNYDKIIKWFEKKYELKVNFDYSTYSKEYYCYIDNLQKSIPQNVGKSGWCKTEKESKEFLISELINVVKNFERPSWMGKTEVEGWKFGDKGFRFFCPDCKKPFSHNPEKYKCPKCIKSDQDYYDSCSSDHGCFSW